MSSCDQLVEFPWESRFEFQCRVEKITRYSPVIGEIRATALANVWSNVHFLGCSYPSQVLHEIKDWEPPPKDHKFEEKLAEVRQLEDDSMYDVTLVNPDLNIKHLRSDAPFRLTLQETETNPICHIVNSAQACRVPWEFREDRESNSVSLYINDVHISDGRAGNLKESKRACAENSVKYLRKKGVPVANRHLLDLHSDEISHVTKETLVGKGGNEVGSSHDAFKISDDNVGCKLLKAMGWTGDTGLGKDGQGRLDPVGTLGQVNRGGLGSRNSEASICRQNVQEQLLAFMRNSELKKLEFSNELDNLERKLIHELAKRYGLGHKSRGSGSERRLTVWKEEEEVLEFKGIVISDEEDEPQAIAPEAVDNGECSTRLTSLTLEPGHFSHQGTSRHPPGKRRRYSAAPPPPQTQTAVDQRFAHHTYRRGQSQRGSNRGKTNRETFDNGGRYVDPYLADQRRFCPGYQTNHNVSRDGSGRSTRHFPNPMEQYQTYQSASHLHGAKKYEKERDLRRNSAHIRGPAPRTQPSSGFGIYRRIRGDGNR